MENKKEDPLKHAEGIKMYVDGDWVKAEGTTLGADNGIGVATIMAILESDNIDHPAIEEKLIKLKNGLTPLELITRSKL